VRRAPRDALTGPPIGPLTGPPTALLSPLSDAAAMTARIRRLAALLVAVTAFPLAARAQGATPAPARVPAPSAAAATPALPPIAARDSARPESIERLIALAYPEQTHNQVMEQTLRSMARGNPMLATAEPALRTFFAKHMDYATLRADQGRVFRETYTEGEVQELTKFYASDIGRRFLAKMPVVMARSQELAAQRMQANLPELMGILQAQMGGRP
jgi:hypothetical protein